MSKLATTWLNEETGEIHTPKGRMAWPTLLEPKRIKDKPDSKPKFSVTLLLPKAAQINLIAKGIAESLKSKFGANWLKAGAASPKSIDEMLESINKKLLVPLLKTEDQENLAQYAAEFPYILRMSANADYQPFIYNPDTTRFNGQPSEIYSGRWGAAAGKFYAYDNVSKGCSLGLNRIQLLDHDEPIAGGRVATSSGFEKFEDTGPIGGGSSDDVFADKPTAGKKDDLDGDALGL